MDISLLPDPSLSNIRAVMEITAFLPPAPVTVLEETERQLGVVFPNWLRAFYLSCNGFRGPTGVSYLYALDGREGVLEFTKFVREEWGLPWLQRAIIFSDNGLGGSITIHWAALDGKLIEWCYGDDGEYKVLEFDLLALWAREQRMWNTLSTEQE
jgi:hypothetical protein